MNFIVQENLTKFQDIFVNNTDIDSRSNHHFPLMPHLRVLTKVLPFSPMTLISHISKVKISFYPEERDHISKEFQHYSVTFKQEN